MDGESLTLHNEIINQLKQQLPEVFTEGKIDWEKLKVTLGENINFSNERYVLNWAGKSDAFRIMQEPSYQTLIPVEEDSVDFNGTENIFIEGENLEVLKVLQKSYFSKVKMIYIDPPYNTGNDSFIYPDRFLETKEEYQKRVGDKDDEGYMTSEGMFRRNSRENGQYHSNWLNMMMPRLYLAKNLLREDGVIFVSIDDNEVHNLRLLMNEIFGEENFLVTITRRTKSGGGSASHHFAIENDFLIGYSKNKDSLGKVFVPYEKEYAKRYAYEDEVGRYFWDTMERSYTATTPYKIEAPDGQLLEGNWFRSEERFLEDKKIGDIRFVKKNDGSWSVQFKQRMPLGKKIRSIFSENEFKSSQVDLDGLGMNNIFSFPKPVHLIEYIARGFLQDSDLILDFFAGSGTTAHAVMQLNREDRGDRKFICVQMPETCEEKSEAYKAGYNTIADIAKERIRRAGKKIQSELAEENKQKKEKLDFDQSNEEVKLDTGFKVFKLSKSNFKQWRQPRLQNSKELTEQLKLFIDPIAENAVVENMVYELLLKSGKELNSRIENNDGYYLVNGNELAFILEKVNEQIITEVLSEYPKKVIALDRIFNGNDQLKTNTALQMKDAGVEFKTK
ncbi:MAG: site-specific DNA-methyltransferase [Proteiniphilum sp.]